MTLRVSTARLRVDNVCREGYAGCHLPWMPWKGDPYALTSDSCQLKPKFRNISALQLLLGAIVPETRTDFETLPSPQDLQHEGCFINLVLKVGNTIAFAPITRLSKPNILALLFSDHC